MPYGVPLQPNTPTTLGFTGEQTDPDDLLYLRARYYHPKLGVFTSVDPVLGVGGSTGWNGYLYANGNPANLTDASGMCPDGYDFVSCLLYDANTTLTYGPRVFGHLWDIAFGSKQQFAEDLKDSWKDGVSGWWSLHQQSLPDLWDFTFQVALPMLWEPADWISGLVNADPVALLPLVPSAARFASHASSPLRVGRRVVEAIDTSHDLDSRGWVIVDRMSSESPGRSLAKRRAWYSDFDPAIPNIRRISEFEYHAFDPVTDDILGMATYEQGYITYVLETATKNTQVRGARLFNDLHREFVNTGLPVIDVRGVWTYGDNLAEFNRLISSNPNMSLAEAAGMTWSGRKARDLGYTKIVIDSASEMGADGLFRRVYAWFSR